VSKLLTQFSALFAHSRSGRQTKGLCGILKVHQERAGLAPAPQPRQKQLPTVVTACTGWMRQIKEPANYEFTLYVYLMFSSLAGFSLWVELRAKPEGG